MGRRLRIFLVIAQLLVFAAASAALATSWRTARVFPPIDQVPQLHDLSVTSGTPFAGDRALLATVSPNGDGLRDQAVVHFRLEDPATVSLQVLICRKHPSTVSTAEASFGAGRHELVWAPPPTALPQTYRLLVSLVPPGGAQPAHGCGDHGLLHWLPPEPVVRVMGIDAGFTKRSYSPGALAQLRVATDLPSFALQLFHAGPETRSTEGSAMEGVPVTEPQQVGWSANRNAPTTISVQLGDWANGIYFDRLTASDGQNYYAPLVVRPHPFGTHRVAVVRKPTPGRPTTTTTPTATAGATPGTRPTTSTQST